MREEESKKVEILYEQLLGMYHGLGSDLSYITGGSLDQYIHVVQELEDLSKKSLQHFLPDNWETGHGKRAAGASDFKIQIGSLLGWLRASYLDGREPHYAQSQPATSISQTVNQEVNVMQVVTLDISEKLTTKQNDFKEGTKERGFIEKVKAGLRGVKDTASLLGLIMQTARQFGLTAEQLSQIFS